ncbi:polysaccharide biosynthesis tyrosine autokinase, partial [Candidatus Peregrinibacteria bacterium]|nr:polysaccharide biosynthesis tyrosine autokinase [Candidatus Peregrinibacteria bacterium]
MELRLLLTLLRRWAWLLILGVALGAGGGFLASQYQEPVYQATTRVMILQPQKSNVTADVVPSDQELMRTYVTLLTTEPVLQEAGDRLGFPVRAGQVSAAQDAGTRLLEVTVRANDPERAALVANTLVEVLIGYNETLQTSRFASSEESLQTQIAQVEQQIEQLQANAAENTEESTESRAARLAELEDRIFQLQGEIVGLELEIEALTPGPAGANQPAPTLTPEQRATLQEKKTALAQLQFRLNQVQGEYFALKGNNGEGGEREGLSPAGNDLALYRQIYTSLLTNYEAVRLARLQSTPNVVQVEAATPPQEPVQPRPVQNTLLGAAVGLIIMGAIAFVIEYLDDTLKTPEDVHALLQLPVIGYVADTIEATGEGPPYVAQHPRSPVAEAFRSLRTNLGFVTMERPLGSILVTSPGPGEGKTTMAANLAVVLAQNNQRVIVVDCDLRRPRLHHLFRVPNHTGLGDLFRTRLSLETVIKATSIDNLSVITSGSLPPNPAELLATQKMSQLLAALQKHADVVLLDSPPFMVSDAAVLASKVDHVLFLVQPGKTHADAAMAMLEQLRRAEANVIGVALNRIPNNRSDYYGGNRYYYSPYHDENSNRYYLGEEGKKRRGGGLTGLWRRVELFVGAG